MIRNFTYQITSEYENHTIGEYLRERGYSHHMLALLKRTENGILRNGAWTRTSQPLYTGDLLAVRLEENISSPGISPVPMELSIVYEDQDILVLSKDADTPVHPSIHNHENTLANGIIWYYEQQGIPFVCRFINRLDRDTSGLLIIAKHMLSGTVLSSDMKERRIHRTYLAIVKGLIREPGTVDAPIARKEGSALERCISFETGERAVTHYEPLVCRQDLNLTLLALRLETGRTHQIRVHMGYLGHPVIGDYLYYPDRTQIGRQALHSWKLEFLHPITKERLIFEAPLPEDMKFILC